MKNYHVHPWDLTFFKVKKDKMIPVIYFGNNHPGANGGSRNLYSHTNFTNRNLYHWEKKIRLFRKFNVELEEKKTTLPFRIAILNV